jgi:hypothetical protein
MKSNLYCRTLSIGVAVITLAGAACIPLHATTLDLTAAASTGTINGVTFTNADASSTGTGVIQSFVRVQGSGTAEGYNADARPVMPDVNASPTFTKDIRLNSVPIVNGACSFSGYQSAIAPLLSLDKI